MPQVNVSVHKKGSYTESSWAEGHPDIQKFQFTEEIGRNSQHTSVLNSLTRDHLLQYATNEVEMTM